MCEVWPSPHRIKPGKAETTEEQAIYATETLHICQIYKPWGMFLNHRMALNGTFILNLKFRYPFRNIAPCFHCNVSSEDLKMGDLC